VADLGPRVFLEFVGRRTRSHWPMLAVVSVGVVAAVMTIAASVIYFDSLGDIALERQISADGATSHDIVISGRETNVDALSNSDIIGMVDRTVREVSSSIITGSTLTYGSPTFLVDVPEEIEVSWRAVLMNAPSMQSNSVLTSGSWPSQETGESATGQLLIEVALNEDAAGGFGLTVGDVVEIVPFWDDVNDSVSVRVSGTYARADTATGFWTDIDRQYGFDDDDLNFLPFVPAQGVFVSVVAPYLPGMTVKYFWRYHVDSSLVNASGAKKLLLGFDEIKAQLQPQIASYSEEIPLQDVLLRNQRQTFFSRLPMTVVFSVIAAVVLYFVGTMSILMVETQRDDIARLRTRAATAKQVVGAFVIEGAIVALLAILLAPPLAALLVKWIGIIPLFSALNGGNTLPVSLGQSAYVVSIITGIAGFMAMVIPASMAAKKTVVSSVRESTRPRAQGAMQKYYLDVALFGLLLVLASQLTSEGSFVDVPGLGAASVDKINVAMPALVLAFGGFVALRLFPVMVEMIARLTSLPKISGFFSPAVTLVLWQMARNPRHYSRLSLLMILTAGLGVFASSFAGTLDVSASDRARYQSGSDLRVNGVSYTNRVQAGDTFRRIAETPGVETVAPAFRAVGVDLTADVGSTFTYLGVDPHSMADIAWFRDDFSSVSLSDQMDRLSESSSGISIPPDARWISLKVRPTVRRADSRVSARLSDSNGRLFTLNLGSLLPRSAAKIISGKDINKTFLNSSGPGYGASPLHLAVLTNNKEIAEILVDNGAYLDLNANDEDAGTPLHWAVYMGNREMSEFLIERGADVNAMNKSGYRPIDFASEGFVRPEWFDQENSGFIFPSFQTDTNVNSDFLKIDPVPTIFTLQSLLDVGFKLNKSYSVLNLDGATEAFHGFYGPDPYSRLEYEVRLYPTHAEASDTGVDFADEVTGEDAVAEELQRWQEGMGERRQCRARGRRSPPDCENPKYFDYIVVGNMVLLCQGKDSSSSISACAELVQSVAGSKNISSDDQTAVGDESNTIADDSLDSVVSQQEFQIVTSADDEEIFAAILDADIDAINRYLSFGRCEVVNETLPPKWCTLSGSLEAIDFAGISPVPPLHIEFIGVGLPNVDRGRFSRSDPPFLDAGAVEIDELAIVLESGERRVIEDFNSDSSWMTVEAGLNQYGARIEPLFGYADGSNQGDEKPTPIDQGVAVMTWNPVVVTQLSGVTVGSKSAPIPVITSTGFMELGGYNIGERINVDVQGNAVPVRIAGVTDYFPTLDPEFSSFIVGDIRSTWMALNANKMGNAEQTNEVWIETGEAAPSEVANAMRQRMTSPISLIAQDQLLRDAAVDPLISAGWKALLAIAFTTVLAASAVGFLVYSQVTFASRMTEYAVVRTLGLTTKQVLGLVTLELSMVLVPAVLVGGLLGMRMGATIIPFLVTSGEGVRVVPPVVLDVDWQSVGVLVGVIGAIFLAISIGLISSVRKISAPRVMRMGQN
jgi:hypothetical protein